MAALVSSKPTSPRPRKVIIERDADNFGLAFHSNPWGNRRLNVWGFGGGYERGGYGRGPGGPSGYDGSRILYGGW